MKIVLDTNVLIASIIGRSVTIRTVLDACRSGEITLVLSKPLLREFGRVLHKPKIQRLHRMNDVQMSRYIADLSTFAEVVPGTTALDISKDPNDNMIFACALEAGAHYIVSGDKDHVLSISSFHDIQTISPKDFVETVLNVRERAA